jgi:hypothetical protein
MLVRPFDFRFSTGGFGLLAVTYGGWIVGILWINQDKDEM